MNWPDACRSSTAWRTAFQTSGTICHSSIRCGVSPA